MHLVGASSLAYRRLLVVVKQTAFETYSRLKSQGAAPKAVRWGRLKDRYEVHQRCVEGVLAILRHSGVHDFSVIGREDLDRQVWSCVYIYIYTHHFTRRRASFFFFD